MVVLMTGNCIDGMSVVGPFEDHDDATEYAERHCDSVEWMAVDVMSLEEYAE